MNKFWLAPFILFIGGMAAAIHYEYIKNIYFEVYWLFISGCALQVLVYIKLRK